MKNSFIINQTDITHIIQHDQVLYCKADQGYCYVYLLNGEVIMNSRTLTTLSKQLNEFLTK